MRNLNANRHQGRFVASDLYRLENIGVLKGIGGTHLSSGMDVIAGRLREADAVVGKLAATAQMLAELEPVPSQVTDMSAPLTARGLKEISQSDIILASLSGILADMVSGTWTVESICSVVGAQ